MKLRTAIRSYSASLSKMSLLSTVTVPAVGPEPDALRCRSLVKLGDCVIDVGANIGVPDPDFLGVGRTRRLRAFL